MPSSPTPAQRRAIEARGDVLVMAGAGAGKTSTLVARILDRVLDAPDRVPLDRLLVVTFNEAAAAEMRSRLQRALVERRQANPDDAWVAEQAALLDAALVSTLHGFCLRLVREHFHELGLDPQFSVQDPLQTGLMRHQILEELLAAHYAGTGPQSGAVRAWLRRHAADGDARVRQLVLAVHDYSRSLPDATGWLRGLRERCDDPAGAAWRELLLPGVREWAVGWRETVDRVAEETPDNFTASEARVALASLVEGPSSGVTAGLEAVVRAGDRGRYVKGMPGYRRVTAWREPLADLLDEAAELLEFAVPAEPGRPDAIQADWDVARDDVAALLELVAQFDAAFSSARRSAAVLDFADLEQMALRLLWNPAAGRPTDLALRWRDRLAHVFVDEYQDINAAQDRIIACVGREGAEANRFFVGDVKQSIYRFRRAAPRIFQGYARAWRRPDGGGTVVPLSENFRSHEAILGFVNAWFGRLMRETVGGVAYDGDARLVFGAPDLRAPLREQPEGRVELHLLLTHGEEAEDAQDAGSGESETGATSVADLDTEERQAAMTAVRLRELRESGATVWDAKLRAHRAVTWRDMVVLHPGPGSVSERWARQFARAGVPFEARRGGFFRSTEVSDLINLARLLDNPLQDLPLLAVLRSPLVGLTVEELVATRLVCRTGRFWEAVERCARGGDADVEAASTPEWREALRSARMRLKWFLGRFQGWRVLSREGAVSRCLERILVETGYEAWLRSQPRSEGPLGNLRRLLAMARQFDQFQRRGLYRFLRFMDAQDETGEEVEGASAADGDAVRLLSMHRSKGLEFPVVVAAGLGRRFNLRDLREEWLLDEESGICPPVLPPGRTRGYASLPRWLGLRRQLRETLGEQIRLMYVACTRAEDRLILVGACRASRLEGWTDPTASLTDRQAIRAPDPLAWLGPLLPALTGAADWAARDRGVGTHLAWSLHRSLELAGSTAGPTHAGDVADAGASAGAHSWDAPETVEALRQRLTWEYPWLSATREPAKAAVTTLRRRWAADEEAMELAEDAWRPRRAGSDAESRARSAEAVARGTAHHAFFELLDLARAGDREGVASELGRLTQDGWLSDEQVRWVDVEGVAAFFETEVGTRIREERDRVQRELPFTLRLTPREARQLGAPSRIEGFSDDDFLVVQGVADLVVFLPEEIWLVDYKTDRVRGGEVDARAGEYAAQLRLYARALSRIYGRPVTGRYLWFIEPRRLIEVGAAETE